MPSPSKPKSTAAAKLSDRTCKAGCMLETGSRGTRRLALNRQIPGTPWQPPPNIPGAVGQQPPVDDQSPAARAARAFPMASQTRQRVQYQGTLERQGQEDQLKRESLATRDTPASRMARAAEADDGKISATGQGPAEAVRHRNAEVIADNNRFERAYEAGAGSRWRSRRIVEGLPRKDHERSQLQAQ